MAQVRYFFSFARLEKGEKKRLLIVVIVSFLIDLLVVLVKLSLAIWTIPIEKNDQRDDKNDIWNRDGGDYGANHLARIVSFQNNPGIDAGVVTWKSLIIFVNI